MGTALLLFASNYPGPHAAFWQYFGAALSHLGLALCFAALTYAPANKILSLGPYVRRAIKLRPASEAKAPQQNAL